MTDQHTVYNSRMFCTQWNGLEKSSIFDDALDDKEYDIYSIRSMRQNPVIADLFHRIKYMERRGSGLRKVVSETEKLPGYTAAYEPEFSSTATDFRVILNKQRSRALGSIPIVLLLCLFCIDVPILIRPGAVTIVCVSDPICVTIIIISVCCFYYINSTVTALKFMLFQLVSEMITFVIPSTI